MEFLSELATYAFKYVILGVIAVAGVLCGVKAKKKQLAEANATEETETK